MAKWYATRACSLSLDSGRGRVRGVDYSGKYRARGRGQVMAYKYTLGHASNMSNKQLLDALMAREVAPSTIVGTGYKNGRQVAIEYLKEMITNEGEGK